MTWLANIPVRTRFFLGLVLLVVLPIAVITIAYMDMRAIHRSQGLLYAENFGNVYDLARLRANFNAERLDIAIMLETPDESSWRDWVQDLNQRQQRDEVLLGRLQARLRDQPEQAERLRQAIAVREAFNKTRREQVLPLLAEGKVQEAKRIFMGPQLQRHEHVRSLLRDLEAREVDRARDLIQATDNKMRRSLTVFTALGVGMAIVGLVVAGAMQWMAAAYVSARRQREQEIRRANAYNRSLIEASLDPLVTIGEDGKITDVNAATETVTGRSRDELIGDDFSNYFTEPDKARAGYEQAFREGYVRDYPLEIRHRDGRTTPVLYNATVYRDPTGAILGVFAAARDITERKRAEEALSRANAYNRSLIEASLDPLVTIGEDGKITDVNAATETITGHSREQLIGDDFSNYFTEPNRARAGYEEVFRVGYVRDYLLEIRHRDGQVTPVLYNATLYRDSMGKVLGAFAAARDITERKRAEEQLKEKAALINLAHDAIIVRDIENRVVFWNHGAEVVYGWSADEAKGRVTHDLLRTRFPLPLDQIEAAVRADSEWKGELIHLAHDGRRVVVDSRWSLERDSKGNPIATMEINRDVTERKHAEEALRASEERFRLITETVEDVFWMSTPGVTEMIYASPAYERVWGRSRESLYRNPRSFADTIHSGDETRLKDALELHRQGKPYQVEYRIVRADGLHWMRERGFPVLDNEGRVRFMTGVVSDITPQKQLEAELRAHRDHLEELVKARTTELEAANARLQELDRLKSMFIASMSHELRTPLNSIIGFTGVMLQGMAGDINREQRKQLTMVKESAAHLLALINDVIDVSKIEAGMVELSVDMFDLGDLTDEVARSFDLAVNSKGLALRVDAPSHLIVEGDRRRIKQILVNLVGNAVKFTDVGGIDIQVSGKERGVEVAVHDTGIGISENNLPKLFNAFSQVVTEGRSKEGSGLGLYLSAKIAHLMKGDISVQSVLGKGSVFTLSLPLTVKKASFKGAA